MGIPTNSQREIAISTEAESAMTNKAATPEFASSCDLESLPLSKISHAKNNARN